MTAGVVSCMLLCWGWFCELGYWDIICLFFGTSCSRPGDGLPPGFCYVFVCVGLEHLVLWK